MGSFLDDLEAALRAASRGGWYQPNNPAGVLVRAALGTADPRFAAWFERAEDLRGQLALARMLLGMELEPAPGDLKGAGGGVASVFAARVRDVLDLERFDPWQVCIEYRLVVKGQVTRLGELFLTFSRRDRRELLQTVGAELADGRGDRWHLSAQHLRALSRNAWILEDEPGEPLGEIPNGWWVASALGLIAYDSHGAFEAFSSTRLPPDSTAPLTAVVRSLLNDERAQLLGGTPRSTELLAPFVHGMRNRMRPLESAVRRIRTSAPSPEALAWVAPLVDDVERRLRAVDEVVERLSAPLGFVTSGTSTVRAAVLGAVRTFEVENGMLVDVSDGPDLSIALAPNLLTEALLELLRNAREAGAAKAAIGWSGRDGGGVEVVVTNDGPPIPPPSQNVFEPGVSSHGEGRGNGLAHLRDSLTRQGATLSLTDPERVTFRIRTPGSS